MKYFVKVDESSLEEFTELGQEPLLASSIQIQYLFWQQPVPASSSMLVSPAVGWGFCSGMYSSSGMCLMSGGNNLRLKVSSL